jgi:SSS family solute:Na+ symporter
MILASFAFIILLALGAGFWSRRGAKGDIDDYLVGSRSFGGLLVFVLAVGEVYSIGTLIGFPGGVYAAGASYGVWFIGYILLAYPIGYWFAPYLWRAGKLYGAMTLPDAAGRHFRSRGLERLLALAFVVFLIPWGQLQLTGLQVAMAGLGIALDPTAAVLAGAALAVVFLMLSGVRAPAFVSFVKDLCLLLAAVLIGIGAVGRAGGLTELFAAAERSEGVSAASHFTVTGSALSFAVTTIVFQALGFYVFPFIAQAIFSAKSEATIKRTTRYMPLYMLMYPFLIAAAFASITLVPGLEGAASNQALLGLSREVLPDALTGIVAGGAALCAIVVLCGSALGIGSMVSRNILPNVPEKHQRSWVRGVIVGYMGVSLLLTLAAPALMLTLINTAYYGITQAAPLFLVMVFGWRIRAQALAAGLLVGEIIVLWLYLDSTGAVAAWCAEHGINIGLVALVVNVLIVGLSRALWPATAAPRGLRSYRREELRAEATIPMEQPAAVAPAVLPVAREAQS